MIESPLVGTSFHDIVELCSGLLVLTGMVGGATKLGRVMERQEGAERRGEALAATLTEQLDRMEKKIDLRESTTAQRLAEWAQKAERWDGRHTGAERRLEDLEKQMELVRERTHVLGNELNTDRGKLALVAMRIDTLEVANPPATPRKHV